MTTSLFGRSAELKLLDQALQGVAEGTGSVTFIEGEPGIGKTALLEAATARARELGFRVFSGRAEELEQDRPFRAISEALGCGRSDEDARRIEIARLLSSTEGGEGLFYRLIDAIEDFVEAETLSGPTLLTIDDLQWADPGTVRALASISRRIAPLSLAIVATLRRAPRSDDLTALLRTTSAQAVLIELRPLDQAAVVDLVDAHLSAKPGPMLHAHIDGAGGNPFYILELLDALGAESALHVGENGVELEGSALPPSLVLTILRRLSALPDDVLEVLRSAAVLGGSFRIEDLATAAGVSDDEALATVHALRSHGVFADEDEKVRFRHDLIREAVYSDLGEPIRVSMHRRIAQALAKAGASPVEVAGHLMRGALPGDTGAANRMIEAADDPATDQRTELALIERALEINPGHPQRTSLIPRFAGTLMGLARPAEAIPHLQTLLPQVSGIERLRVLQWLMVGCYTLGRDRETRSWAMQIPPLVSQIGEPDSPGMLVLLAWATELLGDLEGALAFAERAVALAGESEFASEANDRSSYFLTLLCRPDEALVRSDKARSLAEGFGEKIASWARQAWALGDLDRIDEAETALAVARSLADERGMPMSVAKINTESAHLRYSLGRWDEAWVDAETAATISDEFDFAYYGPSPSSIMAWIAYHRHADAEFDRIRSDRPSLEAGNPPLRPTLEAVATFDRGDTETANGHARKLLNQIAAAPTRRDFDVLPVLARIALAAGDDESAGLGRDTAVRLVERSDAPGVALAAARCRAIVDRDGSAAQHAVELARSSPRRLLAAQAFEDAATVFDRDEAVDVLSQALELYEQMGAIRDQARVAARLEELGVRAAIAPVRARAVSGWEALTPSELEVVRLATDGLTNREIGSRLFVSHRTVATHLSHVFDKLGMRSRVELAREAVQRLG